MSQIQKSDNWDVTSYQYFFQKLKKNELITFKTIQLKLLNPITSNYHFILRNIQWQSHQISNLIQPYYFNRIQNKPKPRISPWIWNKPFQKLVTTGMGEEEEEGGGVVLSLSDPSCSASITSPCIRISLSLSEELQFEEKFLGSDFFFESTHELREFSEFCFIFLLRSDLHIRVFGGKIVICYLHVPALVLNSLKNIKQKLYEDQYNGLFKGPTIYVKAYTTISPVNI